MGIQVQPSCCGKWLALSSKGWLFDFNPETAVLDNPRQTNLGETPDGAPYDNGFSLQWHPVDHHFWTVVWVDNAASQERPELRRINTDDGSTELVFSAHQENTGLLTSVFLTDGQRGIAIADDGRLVGINCFNAFLFGGNQPYSIDQSGLLKAMPAASTAPTHALDWGEGKIWGYHNSGVLSNLHPTTGLATTVSSVLPSQGTAMAYDQGKIYLIYDSGPVKYGWWDIASSQWAEGPNPTAAGGTIGVAPSTYGVITGLAVGD